MQTQRKELNFEGQNIYVGLDVHLKGWNTSVFTDKLHHKTFNGPPKPEALKEYLSSNFPNGNYFSAYEAGFCGLWAHYRLEELGIHNIVINPADVPTTQKEQMHKSDPVDSKKIGRSLRANELTGIYIPRVETLEDRSLIRVRSTIVKDMTRIKQRIKSMLYFYGTEFPKEFENGNGHWSKRFIIWLKSIEFQYSTGTDSIQIWIKQAEQQRLILLEATRKIKELSKSEHYAKNIELLRSIPGIGLITGMTLLVEIEDIHRFENSDKLAGFIGLIPTCHSSGENESRGEMTPRRHKSIRKNLIESSWIAARRDPALSLSFSKLCFRMESTKAITRIARKLVNRIFFVLSNQKEYEYKIV
ncbi:MAG: IS110 family transposase [Paludibacter sp.]|nr:IS110 family transposase [Paludibacter sp.]